MWSEKKDSPIILLLSNLNNSGLDQYAKIYYKAFPEAYYLRMCDYVKIGKGFQWKILFQLILKSTYSINKFLLAIYKTNSNKIHICDNPIFSYYLIQILIKKKYKIIFTLHDPNPHIEKKIFKKITTRFEKYFFRKIFILSEKKNNSLKIHIHSKSLIPCDFPNVSTIDIPHPIYENNVQCLEENSILYKSKLHFVFLGRIEYYKGIDLLIDSMSLLDDTDWGPNIKCTIAGSGNYSIMDKEYKHIEYVYINRYISDEEFLNLLNNTDYLILPYRDVSQSGILSKALTYNIPVICSNIGYLGDIVKKNNLGLVMNDCSTNSLTLCFINALKNRDMHLTFVKEINMYKIELMPDKICSSLYSNFKCM